MKVYCLYDRVAMVHGDTGIFMMRSHDVAKRTVRSALNSPALSENVRNYPGDFDLVCLGELDQANGSFESKVETVCNLATLKGD